MQSSARCDYELGRCTELQKPVPVELGSSKDLCFASNVGTRRTRTALAFAAHVTMSEGGANGDTQRYSV